MIRRVVGLDELVRDGKIRADENENVFFNLGHERKLPQLVVVSSETF
jgi:hypothetical protein